MIAVLRRMANCGTPLAAVALTSGVTLLTILVGLVSNKLIAVLLGANGIALMGLYRNLAAVITRTSAMGIDTVLIHRISTRGSDEKIAEVFSAVTLLGYIYAAILILLCISVGAFVANGIFSSEIGESQILPLRVVFVMAFVNLLLQLTSAVLTGGLQVKAVSAINAAGAVCSVVLLVPLLRLGDVGLAINVGSGNVVACLLALRLVWGQTRAQFRSFSFHERWIHLRQLLSRSTFLILQPFAMMAGLLVAQALIARKYGLDGLGAFTAASIIVDTTALIVMASAKSFYLPSLGNLDSSATKHALHGTMTSISVTLATSSAVLLVLGKAYLVHSLFTAKFGLTPDLLAQLSLSLPSQALIWCANTYCIHRGRYRLVFALDSLWMASLLLSTMLCCFRDAPLTAVAWGYTAAYTLSGLLYCVVLVYNFGASIMARETLFWTVLGLGVVASSYAVSKLRSPLFSLSFLLIYIGAVGGLFLHARSRSRRVVVNECP